MPYRASGRGRGNRARARPAQPTAQGERSDGGRAAQRLVGDPWRDIDTTARSPGRRLCCSERRRLWPDEQALAGDRPGSRRHEHPCHPARRLRRPPEGLPHVWYRHEFGRRDHAFRFHFGEQATFAAIERLSDRVIVNSRSVLEDAPGRRFRSKARLVAYAVTVPPHEPYDGPRDGPLRLVQIGRIAPSKGHKDAVRAGESSAAVASMSRFASWARRGGQSTSRSSMPLPGQRGWRI